MPFTKSNGSNCAAIKNGGVYSPSLSTIFPTQGNYLGDTSGNLNNCSTLNAAKVSKGHVTSTNVITTKDPNGG